LVNPILSEGQRAPAFTLPASSGNRVRLTELRGHWVVLYFYPKDMTKGCVTEACDFRARIRDFQELGAVVIGMSPDSLESHVHFAKAHRLPFPLLVDRDSRVASKYGVWRERTRYGRPYLGTVRSTFVIDPGGKLWKIYDNVRIKGHVEKVLRHLRAEVMGD